MSEQFRQAEEACIQWLMTARGLDHGEATRAFVHGVSRGLFTRFVHHPASEPTRVIAEEVAKATQEGKVSTGAFERHGIALRGAAGDARSVAAILSDVADKMEVLANATERHDLAAELFGPPGATQMVALLAQGAAAMKDLEFNLLVGAYQDALTGMRYSGAAERHVRDIVETGRQAVRARGKK